jgi:hypothetical protein
MSAEAYIDFYRSLNSPLKLGSNRSVFSRYGRGFDVLDQQGGSTMSLNSDRARGGRHNLAVSEVSIYLEGGRSKSDTSRSNKKSKLPISMAQREGNSGG